MLLNDKLTVSGNFTNQQLVHEMIYKGLINVSLCWQTVNRFPRSTLAVRSQLKNNTHRSLLVYAACTILYRVKTATREYNKYKYGYLEQVKIGFDMKTMVK